jgi:polyferredoxin
MCVRVCPTGIDIRNGLQLECISCTQCIDACDSVMARIERPDGLIRYDTENGLAGRQSRIFRPRVLFYGVILLAYVLGATYWLNQRELSEAQVLRASGEMPFRMLDHFTVSNHLNVRISNKSQREIRYAISAPAASELALVIPLNPVSVGPGKIVTAPVFANFPRQSLEDGRRSIVLEVTSGEGFLSRLPVVLLGPDSGTQEPSLEEGATASHDQ